MSVDKAESDVNEPVEVFVNVTNDSRYTVNEIVQLYIRHVDACEGVICDRTEFGTYEQFNSRLYEYAVSTGKIIKIPFLEEQLAQL